MLQSVWCQNYLDVNILIFNLGLDLHTVSGTLEHYTIGLTDTCLSFPIGSVFQMLFFPLYHQED